MKSLDSIIGSLGKDECCAIRTFLWGDRGDKLFFLFEYIRERKSIDEIKEKLWVSNNSYKALRYRLYEKLQDFFITRFEASRGRLARKVARVNDLIYNEDPERAIMVLNRLADELEAHDMPFELMKVYNALKKLHLRSSRYYHYKKLYNQQVAQTMAVDKVEDGLMEFIEKTGYYLHTLEGTEVKERLSMIQDEVSHLYHLYQSSNIKLYVNIINIVYSLFVVEQEEIQGQNNKSIDEVIEESFEILDSHPGDSLYNHIRIVFYYLAFEYYYRYGIYDKMEEYYIFLDENKQRLFACNFFIIPGKFMLSKLEKLVGEGSEALPPKSEAYLPFGPEKNNPNNYIFTGIYKAMVLYYNNAIAEAVDLLNYLRNEFSLQEMVKTDLEVKLLLALFNLCLLEFDVAMNYVRKVERKLRKIGNPEAKGLGHIPWFLKAIKEGCKETNMIQPKMRNIRKYMDEFKKGNKGRGEVLKVLIIDENLYEVLSVAKDREVSGKS